LSDASATTVHEKGWTMRERCHERHPAVWSWGQQEPTLGVEPSRNVANKTASNVGRQRTEDGKQRSTLERDDGAVG
jgi:hypothetical protein